MNVKTLAGIVLIVIGAIGLLTGGFRSATAKNAPEAGAAQTVQAHSGLATTKGVLTGVCLLGGIGLVVAGAIKK